MAASKQQKGFSVYILPVLFAGLLITLALLNQPATAPAATREIEADEPLTLTDHAIENYLFTDGFLLQGDTIVDADGQKAATLTVTRDERGEIASMTLSFPLPTYIEAGDVDILSSLKARHDEAAQRGVTLFLSLFDAVAVTDRHIPARRDNAVAKLNETMRSGKSATQSASSWRIDFSLAPGEIEGTVTILFTLVK